MTTLSALSSDVLGLIVDTSPFTVFLRLWLCGNRALSSTLAVRVTNLSLLTSVATLCPPQVPRSILSVRNLRCLTIQAGSDFHEHILDWKEITKSLPSTLEKLELNFAKSIKAVYDYDNLQPLMKDQHPLIDFHSLFPNLHTLKFDVDWSVLSVRDKVFQSLPPTLTHLSLGATFLVVAPPFMALLPRSLTRLESKLSVMGIDEADLLLDWAQAPPNLHYIEDIHLPDRAADWLPQSLIDVTIGGYYSPGTSVELLRSLPSTLSAQCLILCDLHTTPMLLEALPSKLVSLSIDDRNKLKIILSVQNLRSLPFTLQKLRYFGDVDWESISQVLEEEKEAVWPPHLCELFLTPQGIENLSTMLRCVPRTLLTLGLSMYTQGLGVELDASLLPPHLVSFTTYIASISSIRGEFPSTLQTLRFSGRAYQAKPLVPIAFPHNLTHLLAPIWNYHELGAFPASLTHLELEDLLCSAEPNPKNYFGDLPVSLKVLRIEGTKSHDWPQETVNGFDFSSLVNLHTLQLRLIVNARLAFPTLPKGIRKMVILGKASPADGTHLPPLLRQLDELRWDQNVSPDDAIQLANTFPPLAMDDFPRRMLNEKCKKILRARRLALI